MAYLAITLSFIFAALTAGGLACAAWCAAHKFWGGVTACMAFSVLMIMAVSDQVEKVEAAYHQTMEKAAARD